MTEDLRSYRRSLLDIPLLIWLFFLIVNVILGAVGFQHSTNSALTTNTFFDARALLLFCMVFAALSLAVHWSIFSSRHLDELQLLASKTLPDNAHSGGLLRALNLSILDSNLSGAQQLQKVRGVFISSSIVKYALNESVALLCFVAASLAGFPEIVLAGASVAVVLQLLMFPRERRIIEELQKRAILRRE